MNKHKFYISIILLLLLSNAVLIYGFLHRPKQPPMQVSPKEVVVKALHFDDAQIEKYDGIINVHQELILDLKKELNRNRQLLYAQLSKPKNDTSTAIILQSVANLELKIEEVHFKHFLDIKSICRDDQMPDFEQLCNELNQLFGSQMPKQPQGPPTKQ
jgi:hypothetical protein